MQRREFKLEAAVAQASVDLGVHQSQLRDWAKKFAEDPQHAFPGNDQMKPEQLEIARWDNAAMESLFSSLKTERIDRKTYRTRDQAKADVFDYIERFYNPERRQHSTIGYLSSSAELDSLKSVSSKPGAGHWRNIRG